jgi:hypothetical protein
VDPLIDKRNSLYNSAQTWIIGKRHQKRPRLVKPLQSALEIGEGLKEITVLPALLTLLQPPPEQEPVGYQAVSRMKSDAFSPGIKAA